MEAEGNRENEAGGKAVVTFGAGAVVVSAVEIARLSAAIPPQGQPASVEAAGPGQA